MPALPSIPGHDVVLDIQNLKTYFFTYDGVVRAIDGINLQARSRETTGIVGETGCGKSVTAFSVARLISEPGQVISGRVLLNGANLLWGLEREAKYRRLPNSNRVRVMRRFRQVRAANERMSAVRGKGIGMIFQEPSQAMNPVFSISDQLGEAVFLHKGVEVLEQLLRASGVEPPPVTVEVETETHEGSEEAPAEPGGGSPGSPAPSPSVAPPPVAGSAEEISGGSTGELPPVPPPEFTIPEVPAPALPPMDGARPPPDIDGLLEVATNGTPEDIRAKARQVAEAAGLPSLEPELYYAVKDSPALAEGRRRRVERVLRRTKLSRFQRLYLLHRRRIAILERAVKEVYLQEMVQERPFRRARAGIRLRILSERVRHLPFGVRGVRRRLERPIKNELFWQSVGLLEGVRVANPVQVAKGYPHELSGGMLQRAMIAMALSSEPSLLLADEPTTALDVTIQAQILDLMAQLRDRVGTAIILITHDLGVVAEVCDWVNVMYAGIIVESAAVHELFRRPLHPYTQGLLASIPRFDQPGKELSSIPGSVPNLIDPPQGCRFTPRCPYAMPICRKLRPQILPQGEGHSVACHLYTQP